MDNYIGDLTLGTGTQARMVLHILADMQPDFLPYENGMYIGAGFYTGAFYNCREEGIVITMMGRGYGAGAVHYAFFEHRNSDSLCCWRWETEKPLINPPTIADVPEDLFPDKWTHSHTSEPYDAWDMASWIYNDMAKTWKTWNVHLAKRKAMLEEE